MPYHNVHIAFVKYENTLVSMLSSVPQLVELLAPYARDPMFHSHLRYFHPFVNIYLHLCDESQFVNFLYYLKDLKLR